MRDFYGVELEKEILEKIIEQSHGRKNMNQNIKDSYTLPFGISSNFRSGEVGGWREEFSKDNIVHCKKIYGDALIKFGYETNYDW